MRVCDLEYFKTLIFKEVEICGSFKCNGDCLEIEDRSEVEGRYGERNMCQHRWYSPFIWHTHQYLAKAYPSGQDITKVIVNKEINCSYIFTTWGVWVICYQGSRNFSDREKENEIINNYYSRVLYENTDKGRGRITEYHDQFIKRYISQLEKRHPGLSIQFFTWD